MKKSLGVICLATILAGACSQQPSNLDWPVYGGSNKNNRYSAALEIDTNNVHQLTQAWEYHTGDADSSTQIQVNPLVVDGVLYGISPKLKLFALDAGSGHPKWIYDPVTDSEGQEVKGEGYFSFNIARGLAHYSNGDEQLLFYSANSFLYCINAADGQPVRSFGQSGKIDLHKDLDQEAADLYIASTSPGIIYKDMIIIGMRVAEESRAAPGHIRAYDVHTGKRRWIFHTIPQPGEPGFETWQDSLAYKYVGGANSWAGFSLDEQRGIVYVPTGSAVYDFYGGKRVGSNLYANCILALDAATGKRIWHYQTVHHDVWDRDLPTAPVLLTINKEGKKIDALAQVSKSGYVFLLDRTTGVPLYPIPEKPVPVDSDLTGEVLSPTQPAPEFPEPFVRQHITATDLNRLVSPESQAEIRERFNKTRHAGMFDPPSRQGTLIFPGFDGGAEWGGPAYDPETNLLYVNANEIPWILTMVDKKQQALKETIWQAGNRIYRASCMGCHGADQKGTGNNPSLLQAGEKYSDIELMELLITGRRMMPSFAHLSEQERKAVALYIKGDQKRSSARYETPLREEDSYFQLPYVSTGYHKFLTKEGYPAVSPPWGTLNAIDLSTGKIAWKKPLGVYPELKAKGLETGTENYGGPVVTAGGLVFIAASSDRKIRAFHKRTGEVLWEADLPAPGFATPSVYTVKGKQYIVIACGGGKLGKKGHDSYIAFALP
ncbi:PQQ-binding-like beta-propeller repeat protein [Flavihumibacter sp. UBA7668]|uniref:outer membrane protein assembly factor BamB family protein n=1 Tax=Flavihumibacter sp. UBA7668 TaxID=1946542 RepID=UPI0025BF7944|nr:PQQ-binding-like beta-propeller repeat protein [Flavihumibacter sp. UBA7668]